MEALTFPPTAEESPGVPETVRRTTRAGSPACITTLRNRLAPTFTAIPVRTCVVNAGAATVIS